MSFDWDKIHPIDGWLWKEEAKLLYDLAFDCPSGQHCMEIGSWKGKSTVAMAQTGAPIIALDWFHGSPETAGSDTLNEYLKNTLGYSNIETFVGKSLETDIPKKDLKLHLLYIDAEHSYEACKADFEKWSKFMVKDGSVVFHDAFRDDGSEEQPVPWPGVNKFVNELRLERGWVEMPKVRRCAVFRKLY